MDDLMRHVRHSLNGGVGARRADVLSLEPSSSMAKVAMPPLGDVPSIRVANAVNGAEVPVLVVAGRPADEKLDGCSASALGGGRAQL
jgi:hypothetical protein